MRQASERCSYSPIGALSSATAGLLLLSEAEVARRGPPLRLDGGLPSTAVDNLRYSDRRKLADAGSLGPLEYDKVPEKLRRALASVYVSTAREAVVGQQFDKRVCSMCEQHFGQTFYGVNSGASSKLDNFLNSPSTSVADVLDVVEILVEEAVKPWQYTTGGGPQTFTADAEIEQRINAVFTRHRFGYRLDGGQVVRIGSPAMDEAVVGPALLAVGRPGWEKADRSYRDALHHRRGAPAERGAAITDAHAALEAAMKAAGLKGDTLASLSKSFRNSGMVLPQLEGVPDALDKLLKRSSAVRDDLSDAHGRGPGEPEVPPEIVDLAIHWTGAFIVYLSDAVGD